MSANPELFAALTAPYEDAENLGIFPSLDLAMADARRRMTESLGIPHQEAQAATVRILRQDLAALTLDEYDYYQVEATLAGFKLSQLP